MPAPLLPREIVQLLDLTQIELENDSFVDARLRRHFSDLLYRVGLAEGGAAFIYFLLEHKSAPDEWAVLQLLRYLAQAWERLRQRGAAKLPVIIPVIFYHEATAWNAGTRLSEQIDWPAGSEALRRYVPEVEAWLCDISQFNDEELVGGGVLPADLRLMKHIFRGDLEAQLDNIFNEVAAHTSGAERAEHLEMMVHYVTQTRRVSQDKIGAAIERMQKGDKPVETVIDKWRQEGAAELTLSLLSRRMGDVEQGMQTQVRNLPAPQLQQLMEALFDFRAPEDLQNWLQRHSTAARKRKNAPKPSRKKS